jgi:polyvinyl alcohol dehydrogenase (cytochrome)
VILVCPSVGVWSRKAILLAAAAVTAALLGATPAFAQAPDGAAIFTRACATCHTPTATNAPTPDVMRRLTPEAILNSLTNGRMQVQGAALSEAERRAVIQFLTGRAPSASIAATPARENRCASSPPLTNAATAPGWNGWGNGNANTRFASQAGLTAADLPRLKLKWAFGYSGVSAARAQPTIAGGRLFATSENGEVHALDPKTGCTHWTFKAQAGVRTAPVVGPYAAGGSTGQAVYFGDTKANAYAVDATSGRQVWVRKVDDHASAALTGALAVYGGKVYVPVQGLNEEGMGGRGGYQCCTFRGSLVALDANTGAVAWKTYTVDEAKPRAKNAQGVQMWGPAGGGIWSAPTIDAKRGSVYVATGNGYADPPQAMTDAVVAMDLQTGRVRWVKQMTSGDSWTMGCQAQNPDNPACPATLGPDYDFSASPSLTTVNGRDMLVLPQKSGIAWSLDPDKEGTVIWQQRIGQGSGLGGQWGGAVDGQNGYFGVSDLLSPNPGGMRAVSLATGQMVWSVGPQKPLCGEGRTCRPSQGAAVTVIPGAVLSGSLDGGMRAYSTSDGTILWTFDSNREFQTVNGVKALGGGLEGPGAIVSGGMLYFNSGYGGFIGNPGNVLLAFAVE